MTQYEEKLILKEMGLKHHNVLENYISLFCLPGKCHSVIDIFHTVCFICVPCFRVYDLGSH